jgi:hypothetical protein
VRVSLAGQVWLPERVLLPVLVEPEVQDAPAAVRAWTVAPVWPAAAARVEPEVEV